MQVNTLPQQRVAILCMTYAVSAGQDSGFPSITVHLHRLVARLGPGLDVLPRHTEDGLGQFRIRVTSFTELREQPDLVGHEGQSPCFNLGRVAGHDDLALRDLDGLPELALGRVPLAQVLELELVGLRPGVGGSTGGIPPCMCQPRPEHDGQGLMHPGKLEQGLSPAAVDAAVELQPGTHEKRDTRVGMVLHEDEVHVGLAEGIGHHRLHVLQLFSSSGSPGVGSELELFPLGFGLCRALFERWFNTQGAQHASELVSRTQRSQHVCVGLEREHGHEFLPRLVRSGIEIGQVFQQQVFIEHERRFGSHAGRDGHEAQSIRRHVRQHGLRVLVALPGVVFAILDEERPLFRRKVVRPLLVVTDDGTGSLVAVAEELGEGGMALTTHTG